MPPKDLVSNAPLREAFLRLEARGEVTATEIADRLGWMHSKRHEQLPDSSRVMRALGLREVLSGWSRTEDGRRVRVNKMTQSITYDRACAIVRAMGLDPVDLDL